MRDLVERLRVAHYNWRTLPLCTEAADEIERLTTENTLLGKTLSHCREKLELYRDNSDGQYHGGIEHTALIRMIDTSLDATIKTPNDSEIEGR